MAMDYDPAKFGNDFPILGRLTFLNHAAVAPLSPPAARALRAYADQAESRAYVDGGWYRRTVEVKQAAARLIGARGPHEIAFVPNTSTGLALVARGLEWQPGDNVVVSNVEYPANRYPWEDLRRVGVELREVRQLPDGRVDAEDVIEAINDRTKVVAVSHVQYVSGHRIDLRPISDMVHSVPGPRGYLCVDAIQSVGAMPVDVEAMGIDFLAADGHKWMLGPEGCGIFYCREDLNELLHPAVVGWMNMVDATDYGNYRFEFQPDARRFEPGTYNIPGILALGASIDMLLTVGIDNVWSRIEELTAHLCRRLASHGYRVFSPRSDGERSGIVTFDPPAATDRAAVKRIVDRLQQKNIIIAAREGRLRASPHFYNTTEQLDALIDALVKE
jgi:selenocysteine lyase/cysteine desulfurase